MRNEETGTPAEGSRPTGATAGVPVAAAANNFATLMGGVEVVAEFQDGSKAVVKVLQLAIEKYPELATLLGDEQGQLELYCQVWKVPSPESRVPSPELEQHKSGPLSGLSRVQSQETSNVEWGPAPKGWAKSLTPASHDELMAKAEELNSDFFSRWLRRRMAKMELLKPGLVEKMFDTMIVGGSTSPNTLPKRPLPAG